MNWDITSACTDPKLDDMSDQDRKLLMRVTAWQTTVSLCCKLHINLSITMDFLLAPVFVILALDCPFG